MSWAHHTHERMKNTYGCIAEEIKSQSKDINLIMNEFLIRTEALKRDFTKRQMNILGLIFTFSFGYSKEWALIPKMKDFELAGISSIKIRSEIDQLVEMGVIKWNQVENLFSINDPRKWTVKYHNGYCDNRSRELFILNLQHSGFDAEAIKAKIK